MWDLIEEGEVKDITPRLLKDLGMRFATENSSKKGRYGLYECAYCGKEFEGSVYRVKSGNTKSCGCQINKQKITHGRSNSRFYNTWKHMVDRCSNPNNKDYIHYGGRGISICKEWLDIKNFVDWAERTYPNTKGYSLDRIDNGKGYSPENCRWADVTTQILNQRERKDNTSGYTGVTWHKNVKKWISAIKYQKSHINIGSYLTIEEAVLARDNYIIENKLPHKLSTDYIKQEKINE